MHLLIATQSLRHREPLLARRLLASIEFATGIGALSQGIDAIVHPLSEQSPGSAPAQTVALFLLLSHACGISLCGFMAAYSRVTKQAHLNALQDTLPGIFNRKGIEQKLVACIESAHRRRSPLVIVMVDLDHFKQVN
ncbi:MAG: diguanylate cyclase, partial [Terriglobus sp.]